MKITGFNHFAIRTVDYQASLAFYRDILGFTQLETVDTEEAMFTNLLMPGGCVLEFVYAHQGGKGADQRGEPLVDHIAFDVDDVEAAEEVLRRHGVDIVLSCTDMEIFNTRVVKCKDPNGVVVSFRKDIK
jgi:catechol 2,3-dioxygenase-like lactoylglutathione lyase family enzyme